MCPSLGFGVSTCPTFLKLYKSHLTLECACAVLVPYKWARGCLEAATTRDHITKGKSISLTEETLIPENHLGESEQKAGPRVPVPYGHTLLLADFSCWQCFFLSTLLQGWSYNLCSVLQAQLEMVKHVNGLLFLASNLGPLEPLSAPTPWAPTPWLSSP